MYQLGKRSTQPGRIVVIISLVLAVLLVWAGTWATKRYIKDDTSLNQAPAITQAVKVSDAATKKFQEPTFSIDLPRGWKEVSPQNSVLHPYSWHGASGTDRMRSIDIYVDNIPVDMAVNRLLPVEAHKNGVEVQNAVSDNCASFTGASKDTAKTGSAPAKWSGQAFLCDMANKTRNVTGTSSPDGVNAVNVTGQQGTHRYFFVYTDNSSAPAYDIFTRALATFKAT